MAPEQAGGEAVDERADVFALGGILNSILTGTTVFAGKSASDTIQKAASGETAETIARLGACGADTELIALTTACLSLAASDRPKDARAVAQEVAAYRSGVEGRLRQAQADQAAATAEAREQRKRRRVQLALAAALGMLLLSGGAFGWWQQKQTNARDTERRLTESSNHQAAESALDLAEAAMRKDNPVYGEINVALDQAKRRVAAGGADDLRDRLEAALAAQRMLERLDQIADQRWTIAEGQSVFDVAGAQDGYRVAFREYGLDLSAETPEVLVGKVRQSLIAGPIQDALDDWLGVSVTKKTAADPGLIELLAALDPDTERTAVRRAVANKDQAALLARQAGWKGSILPP